MTTGLGLGFGLGLGLGLGVSLSLAEYVIATVCDSPISLTLKGTP
ncbi:hypothetical protein [Cryobacterium sp. Hb1]|nr:hypothetical protein [Cryobacterium sp. Hb1]